MGGGQFYLYLCVLTVVLVLGLFAVGALLVSWGRREERRARDARRALRERGDET